MIGMSRYSGGYLSGLEHLRQCIIDLLTTRPGTRVMRREYGCHVWRWVDKPMNPTVFAFMIHEIATALDKWEPRYRLTQCDVEKVDEQGRVSFLLQGEVIDVPGFISQLPSAYSQDDVRALQAVRPQSTQEVEAMQSHFSTLSQLLWIIGEQPRVKGRIATVKREPMGEVSVLINGQKLAKVDVVQNGSQITLPYALDDEDWIEVNYLAEASSSASTIHDDLPVGTMVQFAGMRVS